MLKYKLKNYKFRLIIEVMILNIFGILVIGSANSGYQNKQIIGMILGVTVMIITSLIDYEYYMKLSWLIYIFNFAMLAVIMLPMFGDSSKGAQRWIEVGGFRFQPSELAKILIILFFAYYFGKYYEKINNLKVVLISLGLVGVPLVLILAQPDLSTTIATTVMFCFMIFAAGLSWKVVGGVIAVSIPTLIVMLNVILTKGETFLKHHQYLRIMAWLRPEEFPQEALQQQNSIIAIGSGQLLGKGLFNSAAASLKNGGFVYEPHTDFIFAIIGEELGFLGCAFVIIMLLFITLECIWIAKRAKDMQGRLIAVGVAAIIGMQSFVHICVNTGMMPNTGLTLPFVSYGLTSLVSMYIGIGLVLNVALQPRKYRTGVR
ncbi:MAG: rod shape-determining protein RodA [Lachnospiraceae bacterium]|nr:rod shape-determining protein RodA [Lachnospiraceae bacterium]